MNCPVCKDTLLVMSERLGVEIDYCPQCRGIWLDRGELDKIIQLSLQQHPSAQPQPVMQTAPHDAGGYGYGGGHHGSGHHGGKHGGKHDRSAPGGYRRQKSFLERLFD